MLVQMRTCSTEERFFLVFFGVRTVSSDDFNSGRGGGGIYRVQFPLVSRVTPDSTVDIILTLLLFSVGNSHSFLYFTYIHTYYKPRVLFAQTFSCLLRNDGGGNEAGGAGGGGAGGDQGDGNRAPRDGVTTAPAAAVAGAGAGASPSGEVEFNMAAIDLSDMKVLCVLDELAHAHECCSTIRASNAVPDTHRYGVFTERVDTEDETYSISVCAP